MAERPIVKRKWIEKYFRRPAEKIRKPGPIIYLGFGRADNLIRMALEHPERKFIGIELEHFIEEHRKNTEEFLQEFLQSSEGKKHAKRVKELGDIENLKLLYSGATYVLRKTKKNSVDIVNIDYVLDILRRPIELNSVLKEVSRVLSHDGFFFATIPLPKGKKAEISDNAYAEICDEIRNALSKHFEIFEERWLKKEEHVTETQKNLFKFESEPKTGYFFTCRKKRKKLFGIF